MRAAKCLVAMRLIPALAKAPFDKLLKVQLVKDWLRAKACTPEYLNAMPGDHYAFRP